MSTERPPYLVQFAHGVLSSPDAPGTTFSDPLPSFNPLPDQLPANPFAGYAPSATTAAPVEFEPQAVDPNTQASLPIDVISPPAVVDAPVSDAPAEALLADAPAEVPAVDAPAEVPVADASADTKTSKTK